mgnify:CR=1 FL=1
MDKKVELQVLNITNSQAQVGAFAMLSEKASTTAPLAYPPMIAPRPLVIIKNNP